MRKSLAAAMAAITFGGAVAAAAVPAEARPYDHYGYRGGHNSRGNDGAAIVAGIAGLAIGAALADSGNHSYGHRAGYYPRPAYGYGYGYAAPYAVCESSRWVWDPYLRRNVLIRERYAC